MKILNNYFIKNYKYDSYLINEILLLNKYSIPSDNCYNSEPFQVLISTYHVNLFRNKLEVYSPLHLHNYPP